MTAISVHNLVKRFEDVVAVNGISFDIAAGTCVGLLGPNGAGKTTTVEILEGIQAPTSGEVRVLGLRWETDAAAIRERIGLALQQTNFYDRLTVRETVDLFRSFYSRGLTSEEAIARVQLQEKAKAYVMKLSGDKKIQDYNYRAVRESIQRAVAGSPTAAEVVAKKGSVAHPFQAK